MTDVARDENQIVDESGGTDQTVAKRWRASVFVGSYLPKVAGGYVAAFHNAKSQSLTPLLDRARRSLARRRRVDRARAARPASPPAGDLPLPHNDAPVSADW